MPPDAKHDSCTLAARSTMYLLSHTSGVGDPGTSIPFDEVLFPSGHPSLIQAPSIEA